MIDCGTISVRSELLMIGDLQKFVAYSIVWPPLYVLPPLKGSVGTMSPSLDTTGPCN